MHKVLVALLICVVVTPTGAIAQIQHTNQGLDATIGISALQLPIRLAALPPDLRLQVPQERSWPDRHPVLSGALVGLGIGLAVEAAVIPGESGGEPHSAYLPMFGGVGAGIGSLVGLVISAARRPPKPQQRAAIQGLQGQCCKECDTE